tara:strand:+ start:2187 stop:2645 length:459 start_codon:yes stop_codon:yes gene_type:complete
MNQHSSKQREVFFYLGIAFLIISLILVGIVFYLLPHLLFGWVYDVPYFIMHWRGAIVQFYGFSNITASWVIFAILFTLAILSISITVFLSVSNTQIERETKAPEKAVRDGRLSRDLQSTSYHLIRIIMLVLLIIAIVEIFEFIIFIDEKAVL